MDQSFQLHFLTLCEGLCRQEPTLQRKCTQTTVPFGKRLLGKLCRYGAVPQKAPHFLSRTGRHQCIFAEPRVEPQALPRSSSNYHKGGASPISQDLTGELNGYDQSCSSNPINDVHNDGFQDLCISSNPLAAETRINGVDSGPYAGVDGAQTAQDGPSTCPDDAQNQKSGGYANATSRLSYDGVQLAGQHKCTSGKLANAVPGIDEDPLCPHNAPSLKNPSNKVNSLSEDAHQDSKGLAAGSTRASQDVKSSRNSSNSDKVDVNGKVRRFSLNEPGLLKTLQATRALTALEQENLELLMKFKRTNDNLQGQLVIRAVRTEHLSDLENLLTDSYAELMWGPLTYRPVLSWIFSTYIRERQASLPHAVTLVGLYAPSDETNDAKVSVHKWWLAGAVEISFNESGKPKDMQTPSPPEGTPFLSNMAVLKRFRRRGIGRELLKAAEHLLVEMGGNEMYLHCRMIDEVPLNMYKNAGYEVVETDSILSLLLFQRRRHLMCKTLTAPLSQEIDVPANELPQA